MASLVNIGLRKSNFELLRIVAMFFVLIVHADFLALGATTADDFATDSVSAWARTMIESIALVCVNVFVLLSGWFGISTSKKGFLKFLFQSLFFSITIYGICIVLGASKPSIRGVMNCLFFDGGYWFVRAYMVLYVLSPALNLFILNVSRRGQAIVLLLFFIIQTLYGWIGADSTYSYGNSVISFIGLYLLAGYLRRCVIVDYKWGGVFLLMSILNTLLYYLVVAKWQISNLIVFAYNNPITIIQSVALLLYFSQLKLSYNSVINFISKSAFAVYLIHIHPNIFNTIFCKYIKIIFLNLTGIWNIIAILCILTMVFGLSILFDQPRIWLWKLICKHFRASLKLK